MSRFTINTLLGAFTLSGLVVLFVGQQSERQPAAVSDSFEMTVQNLNLGVDSKFKSLEEVFLRATFAKDHIVELAKDSKISLKLGESARIDAKIPLKNEWVSNDALEFKIEVVKQGMFKELVVVRCATISNRLSGFDRSYNCTLPGEASPFLTYRIGKVRATSSPVASAK